MGIDAELASGLKVYARRQVAVHRRIVVTFHAVWDVVQQDRTVYRELLDGHAMDSAPVVGLREAEEARAEEAGAPWRLARLGGAGSAGSTATFGTDFGIDSEMLRRPRNFGLHS
ncbi:hypothetical protein FB451DRAFT_1169605 [Mycena latifolia]|nr:hypothetical protein FB451DRAFT_1169605 [Mycena latifolia]